MATISVHYIGARPYLSQGGVEKTNDHWHHDLMKHFLILVLIILALPAHASMQEAIKAVQEGRPQEAMAEFKRLSQLGLPNADYWIGTLYLQGRGVKKDVEEAMRWLHKSARQEYVPAMSVLGKIHLNGENGKVNLAIARGWYDKAAKGGDLYALLQMGEIYTNGMGVQANPRIGMRYVRRAAQGGLDQAQHILGMAHLGGVGVKKDIQQAEFWLKRAADRGFGPSISALESLSIP